MSSASAAPRGPVAAHGPAVFPALVAQRSLRFDPDDRSDLAQTFPDIALPEALHGAVRRRQIEFLAGRRCAREALRACAPERAGAAIAIGPRREPIWPPDIVGAITHAHGLASVAVARTAHAAGIGLDVERVMRDELAGELLESIADRDEIARLVDATGWTRAVVLTLVFSAKETVFKCLYPQVRRYFDFRDAAVDGVDPARGRFSVRLLHALAPALPAGSALDVRFERDGDMVWTAMLLPP